MDDIDEIRKRDAESGALWFTGPASFTAQCARDRRVLLVEYDRLRGLLRETLGKMTRAEYDDLCHRIETEIGTAVQPSSVLDSQDSYRHPIHQVYFRAGLLACREYMARFVEVESPSIAASIRANWWPSLGKDFGPPRLLKWEELTEGEYGEESFRALTKDEISPTLEALPVALGFLERERTGGQPAASRCERCKDSGWIESTDSRGGQVMEPCEHGTADNSSASHQPAAGGLQSPASGGADT